MAPEVAAAAGHGYLLRPTIVTDFCLPIIWTIDHDERMLAAVCEGDGTLRDIEGYLDAVIVAGTMLIARVGALAVVEVREHAHGLARLFGALAAADRPAKIFSDGRVARRWREAQAA